MSNQLYPHRENSSETPQEQEREALREILGWREGGELLEGNNLMRTPEHLTRYSNDDSYQ